MKEEKWFMVYVEDGDVPKFKHDTRELAEKEAKRLMKLLNKQCYVLEVTPLKKDVSKKCTDYESACRYLCKGSNLRIEGLSNKDKNSTSAFIKLKIIAEAWNKFDNFDINNLETGQLVFTPIFIKGKDGNFYFRDSYCHSPGFIYSMFQHLCFKSEERSTQFGKMFIDLINEANK